MFLKRVISIVVICVASATLAAAQTSATSSKEAAIRELLRLTGAVEVAKSIFVTLIDQYSQALAQDSIKKLEGKNWPPSLKPKGEAMVQDFFDQLALRLREELPKRIKYDEQVGNLYVEVYDDYFTEAEVHELIAFYRSTIGQKFIALPAKIGGALQTKTKAQIEPLILEQTRAIVDQEVKKLEERAARELKAQPRRRKG